MTPSRLNPLAVVAYGSALLVIVVDQLTKLWILSGLDMRLGQTIEISPVFDLTYTLNTGISFGMLSGGGARWALTVFSIVVAGALAWWARKSTRRLFALSLGLIMGGALGNVIDRIRVGAVVDFLDFSGLMFPFIFNVADAAISVGVALLVLDSFLHERAAPVGSAPQKE